MNFIANSFTIVTKLITKLYKSNGVNPLDLEKQINNDINNLLKKWNIVSYSVNNDAYTGVVLECIDINNDKMIIKYYPLPLQYRYIKEKYIYDNLIMYPQVKLLDCDDSINAMLLEQITPGNYTDYYKHKENIIKMFEIVKKNRVKVENIVSKPENITSIIEQTKQEYINSTKHEYHNELMKYLVNKQSEVYNTQFLNMSKYLLHGDIYYKNALVSQTDGIKIFIIDPVGYVDAFVFEYMPYLTYELVAHTEKGQYCRKYKELVEFFKQITNVDDFHEATFIFLVKQLIPSIYEADDGFARANSFLTIIEKLFLDENGRIDLEKTRM